MLAPHHNAVLKELTGPVRSTPSAAFGFEATVRFDPLTKVNQGNAEFRAMLQKDFVPSRTTAVPVSEFQRLLGKEFKPSWNQPSTPGRFGITRGAVPLPGWGALLQLVIGGVISGIGAKLNADPKPGPTAPTVKEDVDLMASVLKAAAFQIDRLPPSIDRRTLRSRKHKRVKLHGYSRRAHS